MLSMEYFVMPADVVYQGPAFDYGSPQLQYNAGYEIFDKIMTTEAEFFTDMFIFEEELLLDTTETTIDVTWGFIKGFVTRNNLTKIQTCLDDVESIEKEVDDILDDFKSLSPSKIVDGVRKLIDIIRNGLSEAETCEQTTSDLEAIEAWAEKAVANPTSIVNHVLMNIGSLITNINKAMSDANNEEWEACGDDMAEITIEILGKVGETYDDVEVNWDLVF